MKYSLMMLYIALRIFLSIENLDFQWDVCKKKKKLRNNCTYTRKSNCTQCIYIGKSVKLNSTMVY